MLATAGSACFTIDLLRNAGAQQIHYVGIVAAPEGVLELHKKHPTVMIWTAAVDEYLNDQKFIVKGLGDFGDRANGTVVMVRRIKRLEKIAA